MFICDRTRLAEWWQTPELHSFIDKIAGNAVSAEAEASASLNFEVVVNAGERASKQVVRGGATSSQASRPKKENNHEVGGS